MILDTDRIQGDGEYRNELRHRCLTDHFFLAEMVGLTAFNRRVHQPAVDLYFPKNPNLSIQDQHPIKNRLHLDPRGTFKTTLGRVDSLQWILAFPETITMVNITATQKLGKAIAENISIYFWQPKGKGPTPLQLCFPELVVDKAPGGSWSTPIRELGQLDSTVDFTSPQSSQSGWHPWILNPDDMVDTENSGLHASADVRQAVIDTYNTNKNTKRAGGFTNMRGTRYHPFDLYGVTLDKMDPEEWKVLIRGAITVRGGRRMLPGEFPEEEDVVLNFPELPEMDYRSLRQKFIDDYEAFMCQQQNDPQGGNIPTFDEDLHTSILIEPERVPVLADTFICWRLPYGGKEYMKRAEGAAARVCDGKVYIIDAWSGIYTPSRLAEKIVRECKRHQTGDVILEDLPGIHYMESTIRNESLRKNLGIRIQWMDFEEDDNLRFDRIRNMEPQARAGRILVSTATGAASELRKQLLNFGLVPENGIVDCMSRLASKVPVSLMRKEIEDEEAELAQQRRYSVAHQFIFGQQEGMSAAEEKRNMEWAAQQAAMQSIDNMGLTDILGGLDG